MEQTYRYFISEFKRRKRAERLARLRSKETETERREREEREDRSEREGDISDISEWLLSYYNPSSRLSIPPPILTEYGRRERRRERKREKNPYIFYYTEGKGKTRVSRSVRLSLSPFPFLSFPSPIFSGDGKREFPIYVSFLIRDGEGRERGINRVYSIRYEPIGNDFDKVRLSDSILSFLLNIRESEISGSDYRTVYNPF